MLALIAMFLDAIRKASLALRWASVAAIVAVVQRDAGRLARYRNLEEAGGTDPCKPNKSDNRAGFGSCGLHGPHLLPNYHQPVATGVDNFFCSSVSSLGRRNSGQ
jgi:hypothetical protein